MPVNDDTPRYACGAPGCGRTDLLLTANNKIRSHTANGKKRTTENPNCPGGSDWPLGHSQAVIAPVTATGSPNPFRPPLPTGNIPIGPTRVFTQPAPGFDDKVKDDLEALAEHQATHPESWGDGDTGEPRTDVDDFLDGDPGGDDDGAADFLDGVSSPRYFPAKFDGSCDTCGGHMNAGDMIRSDRMGGWEGEDCCGDNADPDGTRPVKTFRTLPVKNGRYVFPHPLTEKRTWGSRASKYAEGIADNHNLSRWQIRMALLGMALRPDLVDKVMSAIGDGVPHLVAKAKKTYLDKLGEEAGQAAGSKDRAHNGTKLHKYTEELDGGTRDIADVPDTYRTDAASYVAALERAGFRPIRHLIERSVYVSELGVVGTFDRVLECIRDTEVIDLDGRQVQIRSGEYVIGDVKSNTDLKYAWPEILVQLAIYAHAVNENGIAVYDADNVTDPEDPVSGWSWSSVEEQGAGIVREDVGIVMHVPFGEGRADLRYADLITGWRGAKLCQANREYFKVKMPEQPVMSLMATDVPGAAFVKEGVPVKDQKEDTMPETHPEIRHWEEEFRVVKTKDAANMLWRDARDTGVSKDELARLVKLVDLTPPPPTWNDRAAAVTTREQASALFKEARAAVMEGKPDMTVVKLNELTAVMKEALAKAG